MSGNDDRGKREEQARKMAELQRQRKMRKPQQISVTSGSQQDGAGSNITVAALCDDGSVWIISPHDVDAMWTRLPDIQEK